MKHITGHESVQEIEHFAAIHEAVFLSAFGLSIFLKEVIEGRLSPEVLQQIADALECENVVYEEGKAEVISDVLFLISSPEINGWMDKAQYLEHIRRLVPADLPS